MNTKEIVIMLDAEIARLQEARAVLASSSPARQDGRSLDSVARQPVKNRVLSPAARERIAEAQRKRWAAQKKAAKKLEPVQVTKIPARHAPQRRIARPLPRAKTALTGNIPAQPVAATGKARTDD